MDLHVIAPLPSPAERAAVDAVVGAPGGHWTGGTRSANAGHTATGGHAARAQRHLLLPALQAVQARIGHISEPALAYICRRLTVPPAEAYGVATFYALLATKSRPPTIVHVCDDVACRLAGAEDICSGLERALGPAGAPARDGRIGWLRSGPPGRCEQAPAGFLTVAGAAPLEAGLATIDAALALRALEASEPPGLPTLRASIPQFGDPSLRLIGRIGRVPARGSEALDAYRAEGGFDGLRRAVELGPAATIEEVLASKLVGRGGAAFPTGRKWGAVASQTRTPRYVVCNADESEPGTFKDRLVMEGDPYAVVEGMAVGGFATGAERGFVYVRGEYPEATAALQEAIDRSRAAGLLGYNVLDSGWSFEIEIRRGAGAYIAGEETALFESIEGDRAEPRNKPPFPVSHGLHGQPTLVNNVETLVNVPLLLRMGSAAYAAIGTPGSTGPKLFCLSGNVVRPGLYEVPFGTTLRGLLNIAGGVPGDRPIQAILLGGAAGTFLGPDELDVPLTFEGTRAIGAALGSGVVLVYDDRADLVDALLRIAAFFRDESCGQCVPCRVGTVRQEELLRRLATGQPRLDRDTELQLLKDVGQAMRDASICGLGQTASSAIESALRHPGMVAL